MMAVRDENGKWWVVGDKGETIAGPFYDEETAWEAIDGFDELEAEREDEAKK